MTRTRQTPPTQHHPQTPKGSGPRENPVDLDRLAASVASSLRIEGFEVSAEELLKGRRQEHREPERRGPNRE